MSVDNKTKCKSSEVFLIRVSLSAALLFSVQVNAQTSLSNQKPLQVAGIIQEFEKVMREIKGGTSSTNTSSTPNTTTNSKTTTSTTPVTTTATTPTPAPALVAPAVPVPPPAVVENAEAARRSAMKKTDEMIANCQKFLSAPVNSDMNMNKSNERASLLKLCSPEKLQEIQMKRIEEAKPTSVTPLPIAPAPGGVSRVFK